MLSQIERHQANPTVAVVWRLATALGVGIGELLGDERPAAPLLTTVPAHATPTLASPDGKCELRILGPIELAGQFEWYALTVQPGGTLASQPHEPGSREHLSVLAGALEVQAGSRDGPSAPRRDGALCRRRTAQHPQPGPHRGAGLAGGAASHLSAPRQAGRAWSMSRGRAIPLSGE